MKRVEDKVVIITGAARGIGQATCELLAKEGAKVAVTDLLDAEGMAVAESIKDTGGVAEYWHLDVSHKSEVQSAFQDIRNRFGHIDVLVNNAGIVGVNKPTHELTEAEWDAVQAVDVKGVFFCTKHVIPYLREVGGGSIINISSIYALVGSQDLAPYHAAKGAVRMMSKTDAMTYAKEKIRVNSIYPGCVWTTMAEEAGKEMAGGAECFREQMVCRHPIGNLGEPIDIAYGILYFASDESRFSTGSELVIDGGYTAE